MSQKFQKVAIKKVEWDAMTSKKKLWTSLMAKPEWLAASQIPKKWNLK